MPNHKANSIRCEDCFSYLTPIMLNFLSTLYLRPLRKKYDNNHYFLHMSHNAQGNLSIAYSYLFSARRSTKNAPLISLIKLSCIVPTLQSPAALESPSHGAHRGDAHPASPLARALSQLVTHVDSEAEEARPPQWGFKDPPGERRGECSSRFRRKSPGASSCMKNSLSRSSVDITRTAVPHLFLLPQTCVTRPFFMKRFSKRRKITDTKAEER